MSSTAIGIDLGTTFSCVAIYRNGKTEIIANEQGSYTTPSVVAFNDQERLIGEAARSQAATNAKNTIFDAKRLIGRKFSEKILQEDIKHWPFEVIDENDKPKVQVEYKGEVKILDPEEISAMILERMKKIAENFLGKPVDRAVVTVPAYFNDAQRQATKDAGKIAGLNVMRILNEPTAAAIAYGLQDKSRDASRHILVFDLGGGTFDVTILNIDDGIFEVKATSGDTHLGGEDFDNRMVVHIIDEIKKKMNEDVSNNQRALSRIRTECEKAKRTLSSNQEANIDIESLIGDKDFHTTFSRMRFESLNEEIFQKVLEPVQQALSDAKLDPTNIDDVVLVGGSTRIPRIVELLQNFFEGKQINRDINPDEAVAYGAAVQAAKLAGDASEDLQEIVLLDITPLSLGVETTGGMMSTIIPRNTTVPVTHSKVFTTHKDNQTSVRVQVYEGERSLTKDNSLLGDFRLTGITASRVGQTEIIVNFSVDSNGILNVTAKEKNAERKEGALKIAPVGTRLTPEEIKEKIKRAEEFRKDDEAEKQRLQAKINLESLCLRFQSEFRSPAAKGKIAGSEKEKMFIIIAEALTWIDVNYKATKEEYEVKHKEVHDLCNPSRRKILDKSVQCCEEEEETNQYSYGGID